MDIIEVSQHLLNAQATYAGSAFHAITAALATQGYWAQGEVLEYLRFSSMNTWGALFYLISAMGGMISMVLGQPPKNYLWFFMGPMIHYWLLNTTADVKGVQWKVATVEQAQEEVWRLAEAGLYNNAYSVQGKTQVSASKEPTNTVAVARIFAEIDVLVSEQVQWFSKWLGVASQRPNGGKDTNIADGPEIDAKKVQWHILSGLKWDILSDVTAAELHSLYVRDALTQFMSNECGDAFKASVDQNQYTAIMSNQGASLGSVKSVFRQQNTSNPDYKIVVGNLREIHVPIPVALTRLLEETGTGSFREFAQKFNGQEVKDLLDSRVVNCDAYLWFIIHALRWEAGHSYWQTTQRTSGGVPIEQDSTVFGLLYGWDIKKGREGKGTGGETLSIDEQKDFTKDLIFTHLVRNELSTLPQLGKFRSTSTEKEVGYVEIQQKTVGQKTKFGEIYVWAKMMPYVQGLLLYFLAVAYPFVIILIVMPGWHKVLFTWLSFFVWAKLWDLGFALVTTLEKSLWATIGNGKDFAGVADRIVSMQEIGKIKTVCAPTQVSLGWFGSFSLSLPFCPVPLVTNVPNGAGIGGASSLKDAIGLLDQAIIAGSAIKLDINNSYYIYIMAALYMAVPVITGQLVLGAKSGMANMVGNFTDPIKGEASKGVSGGIVGAQTTKAKQTDMNTQQSAVGKALRAGGDNSMAIAATAAQNRALQSGLKATSFGMQSSVAQMDGQVIGMREQSQGAHIDNMQAQAKGMLGMYKQGIGLGDESWKEALKSIDRKMGPGGLARGLESAPPDAPKPPSAGAAPGGDAPGALAGIPSAGADPASGGSSGVLPGPLKQFFENASKIGTQGGKNGGLSLASGSDWALTAAAKYGDEIINGASSNAKNLNTQRALRDRHSALGAQGYNQFLQQGQQMSQSIDQMAGQRLGTQADAYAQQGSYEATSSWAQDVTGNLSAIGVMGGTASPSPLTTQREGLQSMGQLGTTASNAFNYPISGSARAEAATYTATAMQAFSTKLGGFTPIGNNDEGFGEQSFSGAAGYTWDAWGTTWSTGGKEVTAGYAIAFGTGIIGGGFHENYRAGKNARARN